MSFSTDLFAITSAVRASITNRMAALFLATGCAETPISSLMRLKFCDITYDSCTVSRQHLRTAGSFCRCLMLFLVSYPAAFTLGSAALRPAALTSRVRRRLHSAEQTAFHRLRAMTRRPGTRSGCPHTRRVEPFVDSRWHFCHRRRGVAACP